MTHIPSVGRIVHYYQGDYECPVGTFSGPPANQHWTGTNGTRTHPAIVTRVWSDGCVNLIVFYDAEGPTVKTSACYLPDEVFIDGVHCTNSGWRWPPHI